MNLNNKNTFIFDMDGLLVDSERLHVRFWKEVLPGDPQMIDELLHHTIGTSGEMAKRVVKKYTGDPDYMDRYSQQKDALMHDYIMKEGLPLKKGAKELCTYLQATGKRMILVSSTSRSGVDFSLRQAGLAEFFKERVCGDEIKRTKPAPDIYLKALKDTHSKTSDCVVLEDSINGITASDAAGIDVIGIPDLVDLSNLRLPHLIAVLPSLSDVKVIVSQDDFKE